MKKICIVCSILLLAACEVSTQPPPSARDPLPPAGQDTCGAASYAGLIGQDATALERVLIMRPIRVLRPGMAMTMDFSPERINFEISEAEKVSRIFCG